MAPRSPPARGRAELAGAQARTVQVVKSRDGAIEYGGVRVTHPDKLLYPGTGVTKRALLDYYAAVAERILPHVADRPLSLVRAPDGVGGETFFQKHASKGFPSAFKSVNIKETSKSEPYLYIADERGLFAAVQMGALELHIWGSHVGNLEEPDRIVFDFDPDETLDFAVVKAGAVEMRDRLASIGLQSFPMVTGGKGIHVVVPLTPRYDWDDTKLFCEAMARTMAADNPDRYLAVMSKAKRSGRIFIDYLRNGRGATAIAPFSSRAKKDAPVSWPVSWTELAKLGSAHPVTVENAAGQPKRRNPWPGYFDIDQVLPLDQLGLG